MKARSWVQIIVLQPVGLVLGGPEFICLSVKEWGLNLFQFFLHAKALNINNMTWLGMQTIRGIRFCISLLRVRSIGDYSTATALRAFSILGWLPKLFLRWFFWVASWFTIILITILLTIAVFVSIFVLSVLDGTSLKARLIHGVMESEWH